MESLRCPKCDATPVLDGRITHGSRAFKAIRSIVAGPLAFLFGGLGAGTPWFVPRGARTTRGKTGVRLAESVHACPSCGHVWTSAKPEELRAFLAGYGDKLDMQQAQSSESGSYRDLHDIPEAREAAERATEIDALVAEGRTAEASRRYHEMMGCTWDQANAAILGWRNLDRDRKLAKLGWSPGVAARADGPD